MKIIKENEGVIETEGDKSRLPTQSRLRSIVCPFCDHEIKSTGNVVKCWNCGEAFEREPDEEEFVFGSGAGSGF